MILRYTWFINSVLARVTISRLEFICKESRELNEVSMLSPLFSFLPPSSLSFRCLLFWTSAAISTTFLPFLLYSPTSPPVFLWSGFRTIYISMEVISCKTLHSHFCVGLHNDRFHMEDVEAQLSLIVSKIHLNWFLKGTAELVRGFEIWGVRLWENKALKVQIRKWMGFMLQLLVDAQPFRFFQGMIKRGGYPFSRCWKDFY